MSLGSPVSMYDSTSRSARGRKWTAVAPQRPSSPSYAFNGALGGLAGAVLCCGVLLCRRLLNDTFVTPEEVAGSLGLQPLATIPEAQPEGGAGRPGRTLPRWRKDQS